ncbi:MAG: SMC-Scp complex subunit ScpB [Pseudomonadota bacterium]
MADANAFETKHFIEAALLASPEPLSIDQLQRAANSRPRAEETPKSEVREALKALTEDYECRGIELLEVASGFRIQVRSEMGRELVALFEERPPRYSRAFFETLALIAYRQPITRGEIEDVRGVAVSSNIIRNMMEREWIRIVGHRDVPGKPAMFGTTKAFLDYFNLRSLDELPSLAELTDIESLRIQLDLPTVDDGTGTTVEASNEPISELVDDAAAAPAADASGEDSDDVSDRAEDTSVAGDTDEAPVARQEHG